MALHPASQANHWTFRRVMWATLVLLSVVLGFWLLYRFYQVVFILFVAIVLGTVIRPIVAWLHKRGLPPLAGVILVYILLVVLLIGFMLLLLPLIVEQGTTLAAAVPDYYDSLRAWLVNFPNQWIVRLGEFLPATLPGPESLPQTEEEILATAGQAADYVALAVKAILIATAILLLALHWTLDGPRTIQSLLLLIPQDQRESIAELIAAMEAKVGFFVAGQAVLSLVIGVMALVAYSLIGLPNALVLAVVAGVMEAVPLLGPLLGAIPAVIVAFAVAPSKVIWVIVATIIIQQLENSVLVPRVMRKAVGVNPFVSLLAIFAFSSLFGIAGALIAIPLAAIIQLVLEHFLFQPTVMEPEPSAGRDYSSRLRYEAQDLAKDLRKQTRLPKEGTVIEVTEIDQMMDEIENITTDLDALLAQALPTGKS